MNLIAQKKRDEIRQIGFFAVKLYTRYYEVLGWTEKQKGKSIKLRFIPSEEQKNGAIPEYRNEYIINTPIPIRVFDESQIKYYKK